MTTVKKVYQPLIAFLEEHKNHKISSILPEILELVQSKQIQKTFKVNENGEATHIFCYYHKKWEDITVAEYGKKSNTASGYNTMCKEGYSNWTKQQRQFRKAKEELLTKVMEGTLAPQDVDNELQLLEEQKQIIVARTDGHGDDTV